MTHQNNRPRRNPRAVILFLQYSKTMLFRLTILPPLLYTKYCLTKFNKKEFLQMKEFFGFGGYQREPEGAFSWQHLLFVTSLMVIMVVLAVVLGKKNKDKTEEEKNKVLIVSAIAINAFELLKIIVVCIRTGKGFGQLPYLLPLFLCSLQLLALPIAAFSKGRLKESALDFVFVFGILGALLGTYGATQNYNSYPVLSMDNVISGLTHTISGFASLYIAFSGMDSMLKEDIPIVFGILGVFCALAYIVNILVDYNYMFLMRGDGTPYDILYNLVGGNKVLYPLSVVLLFYLYIICFQWIYSQIKNKQTATATENTETAEVPATEKETEVLQEVAAAESTQE